MNLIVSFLIRWNLQGKELKVKLIDAMTNLFGPNVFQKRRLLEKLGQDLKYIR